MKIIRILLFPFSILYGMITSFRNFLFDTKILKSYQFDIPIICVGNLNVGGTGKTPQIEYLIRLLSDKYKIATLSRGYKRASKGFILANENSSAKILGDEPFQFYTKFKNIQVAVDADRKNGIVNLLSLTNKPEIILLDDAFQHRKVKAGFYILLTTYSDLFCDDFILPLGNLRESSHGANRANLVIVTKCPNNLSSDNQNLIEKKLNLKENQKLFFSFIDYDDKIYSENESLNLKDISNKEKLLIAGIANPKPFFEYLKSENDMVLEFPDHHNFSEKDIFEIKNSSENKIIITTEKDYVRLKNESISNLYYLPIKSSFLNNSETFDNSILEFISKHI
jgi:tetraacyldisaccharide 4'-kinase